MISGEIEVINSFTISILEMKCRDNSSFFYNHTFELVVQC